MRVRVPLFLARRVVLRIIPCIVYGPGHALGSDQVRFIDIAQGSDVLVYGVYLTRARTQATPQGFETPIGEALYPVHGAVGPIHRPVPIHDEILELPKRVAEVLIGVVPKGTSIAKPFLVGLASTLRVVPRNGPLEVATIGKEDSAVVGVRDDIYQVVAAYPAPA